MTQVEKPKGNKADVLERGKETDIEKKSMRP